MIMLHKILVLITIQISLINCFSQNHTNGFSIPNPQMLGKELKFEGIETYIYEKVGTKPKKVTFELDHGVIVGIIVTYPKTISSKILEEGLTDAFKEDKKIKLDAEIAVWRNAKKGYIVTLGKDEGDSVIVIHTPIR